MSALTSLEPAICRRDLHPGVSVEHRLGAPVAVLRDRRSRDTPTLLTAAHPLARVARLTFLQTRHPTSPDNPLWTLEAAHLLLAGGIPLPRKDVRALGTAIRELRDERAHVPALTCLLDWSAATVRDTPYTRGRHALAQLVAGLRRYERLLRPVDAALLAVPTRPVPGTTPEHRQTHPQVWADLPDGWLAPASDALVLTRCRDTWWLSARIQPATQRPGNPPAGPVLGVLLLTTGGTPVAGLGRFPAPALARGVPIEMPGRVSAPLVVAMHAPGHPVTVGPTRRHVLAAQRDIRAGIICRLLGVGEQPFLTEERLHPALLLPTPPPTGTTNASGDMTITTTVTPSRPVRP